MFILEHSWQGQLVASAQSLRAARREHPICYLIGVDPYAGRRVFRESPSQGFARSHPSGTIEGNAPEDCPRYGTGNLGQGGSFHLIASAFVGVLALVAVLVLVRRQRLQAEPAQPPTCMRPGPRYPVVLLHGVIGFDDFDIGSQRHEYFRGVADRLQKLGAEVYRPCLSNVVPVSVRAHQLVEQIEKIPAKRVNIIAHSMGGLDARYAIARLGLSDRVASLTTIATPHRGTPLADFCAGFLGETLGLQALLARVRVNGETRGLQALLARVRINLQAVYDVTTAGTAVFNEEVEDDDEIQYACVLANADHVRLHPLLRPAHNLLSAWIGPNDGLVPTDSQRWGEVLEEIDADHWAQIGWSDYFDAPGLFERLTLELRGRGL